MHRASVTDAQKEQATNLSQREIVFWNILILEELLNLLGILFGGKFLKRVLDDIAEREVAFKEFDDLMKDIEGEWLALAKLP